MHVDLKRELRRPQNGKVAGVCQGLANYFDIDVTLVRVVFVLTLIPGGVPGLLIYLICALVIPKEA